MPEEHKRITMTTRKGGREVIEPTPKAKATGKPQTVKKEPGNADNS